MNHAIKPGGPAKKTRGITLHLRIPTLIGGLLALLVGLVWVFILGILVGRGQAPEQQIPQIAGLMPKVEASALSPPQIAEPPIPTVIPEEELSYTRILRPESAAQRGPTPSTPAKPDPQKPAPEKPPVVDDAKKEVFDYVFQVAAYKSADPCDRLVEKLKKAGLKCSTEKTEGKNVTWYKALVTLRGTAEEAKALEAALAVHKLSAPLLRSKKPVTR